MREKLNPANFERINRWIEKYFDVVFQYEVAEYKRSRGFAELIEE